MPKYGPQAVDRILAFNHLVWNIVSILLFLQDFASDKRCLVVGLVSESSKCVELIS